MNELTREQILSMPAGPKLDMLVAERIMNWKECSLEGRLLRGWGKPSDFDNNEPRVRIPSYSSNIAEAWEVINRMCEKGWAWTISQQQYEKVEVFIASRSVTSKAAQEGICKAALLWVLGL